MRFPFRFSAALLAVSSAVVASPVFAQHAEPTSWLVVGTDTWLAHRGHAEMFRMDKRGNPVVLVEATESQVADLAAHVHEREHRCGGFFAFATREEAEAFIAIEPVSPQSLSGPYVIDNQATVNEWLPQTTELNIRNTITWLSSFTNRYYNSAHGQQASLDLMARWMDVADGRSDVSIDLVPCGNCGQQYSVVLTITGQTLPDEIVVLGGHLDSISSAASSNPQNGSAPGADDDASGIAVLTETLRIALGNGWKPQRTVKFMAYAAEEVGLNGSKAIAQSFAAAPRKNVYAVLQLDMTNYTTNWAGKKDLFIFTDLVDTGLTNFVTQLFDTYLAPLGLTRGTSQCGYGCSDHASWNTQGFPAALVFETDMHNSSPYIHSPSDTLANMGNSAQHSVTFAKLALAFLGETAKGAVDPLVLERVYANGFE